MILLSEELCRFILGFILNISMLPTLTPSISQNCYMLVIHLFNTIQIKFFNLKNGMKILLINYKQCHEESCSLVIFKIDKISKNKKLYSVD